jgi:NAD(P)-dependent dehydrogenase (short-subunit alcohol dehydrogenase family)
VRADVVQIIDCFGLFEPAEIFFVVRQARIIEYHHLDRMAVTPEMLVVCFNGCTDIAQLSSEILTLFAATNQAYFMGFLFLLAGYFTPGSLERKGYNRFLSDRFLRLGLPLLAFSLILGPLTVAMVTAAEGNGFGSTSVWRWNPGPLWFVQALLIFSLVYCAWRARFGLPLTSTQRLPRPIPGPRRIAVNVVAPGAIETDFSGGMVRDNPEINRRVADMTALGRAGQPEDVGPMIASLLSEDNRWVNAQRIEVSGGMSI